MLKPKITPNKHQLFYLTGARCTSLAITIKRPTSVSSRRVSSFINSPVITVLSWICKQCMLAREPWFVVWARDLLIPFVNLKTCCLHSLLLELNACTGVLHLHKLTGGCFAGRIQKRAFCLSLCFAMHIARIHVATITIKLAYPRKALGCWLVQLCMPHGRFRVYTLLLPSHCKPAYQVFIFCDAIKQSQASAIVKALSALEQ